MKFERFCKNCMSRTGEFCNLKERQIKSLFDSCKQFAPAGSPLPVPAVEVKQK